MNFNYAELVVSIEQQSQSLSKAQSSGNIALMISIADSIMKQAAVLSVDLQLGVA